MFQLTELTKEKSIDANIKAYKTLDFGKVWAGLSYRTSFDGAQFQENGFITNSKITIYYSIVRGKL